jgi:hypothetical protein
VSGFSKWSIMRKWEASCDPTLAFESPLPLDGLAAWRAQSADGTIPRRDSLSARALKSCIGNVIIFERIAAQPSRYRIRLMGTRLTTVLGEMQGKIVDESVSHKAGRAWHAALDVTLSCGSPLRFVSRVAFKNLDFLKAEVLLAPLLDDRGEPTMVFGVVVFRAGFGKEDG